MLDRIAVVAGFFPRPDDPVAARGRRAGVEARVGIDQVAIIAALTRLHNAIAAGSGLTLLAPIGRVIVAVVAALAWSDYAVTAAGFDA